MSHMDIDTCKKILAEFVTNGGLKFRGTQNQYIQYYKCRYNGECKASASMKYQQINGAASEVISEAKIIADHSVNHPVDPQKEKRMNQIESKMLNNFIKENMEKSPTEIQSKLLTNNHKEFSVFNDINGIANVEEHIAGSTSSVDIKNIKYNNKKQSLKRRIHEQLIQNQNNGISSSNNNNDNTLDSPSSSSSSSISNSNANVELINSIKMLVNDSELGCIKILFRESLLKYDIIQNIVIFATPRQIKILCHHGSSCYIDGTFSICKFDKQLMLTSIFCKVSNIGVPCLFIIHTNKDEINYKKIMESIRIEILNNTALNPGWYPSSFIMDYEIALRNSLSSLCSSIRILGGNFHLTQACIRWCEKHDLHEYVDAVVEQIRDLITEVTIQSFNTKLESTIKLWKSHSKLHAFASYFSSQWCCSSKSGVKASEWAWCFRSECDSYTEVFIEIYHKLLPKLMYASLDKSCRASNMLNLLMALEKTSLFYSSIVEHPILLAKHSNYLSTKSLYNLNNGFAPMKKLYEQKKQKYNQEKDNNKRDINDALMKLMEYEEENNEVFVESMIFNINNNSNNNNSNNSNNKNVENINHNNNNNTHLNLINNINNNENKQNNNDDISLAVDELAKLAIDPDYFKQSMNKSDNTEIINEDNNNINDESEDDNVEEEDPNKGSNNVIDNKDNIMRIEENDDDNKNNSNNNNIDNIDNNNNDNITNNICHRCQRDNFNKKCSNKYCYYCCYHYSLPDSICKLKSHRKSYKHIINKDDQILLESKIKLKSELESKEKEKNEEKRLEKMEKRLLIEFTYLGGSHVHVVIINLYLF